jgi:chitodextrinase
VSPVVSRIRGRLLTPACLLVLFACGGGEGDDGGTAPPVGNPPPPGSPVEIDTLPPTVPADVTATAVTSTQVRIRWSGSTDAGTGVEGYRVYRDGDGTPIADVTITNYLDTALSPNTSYVYTVRAYDAADPANVSINSQAASVTTLPRPPTGDVTPPSVPTGVTATAVTTTSIRINWQPSSDSSGISEYRVFRVGTSTPIAATQNTMFTDTQLQPNTRYSYVVTAVDGASPPNESAESDPASATTGPGTPGPGDTTPPTVPDDVRVDARSSTSIRIRWRQSRDASGIAEYRVYRNGASTPFAIVEDDPVIDENLTPNTTYTYTVTAVDRANPPNESAHSEPESATTLSDPPGPGGDNTPPSTPENLVATAVSSTQIGLDWSPSSDASGIARYSVYRDGSATPIAEVQTTSFTDGGLEPDTQYTYTVRATDNASQPNMSTDSAPASATTNAAPVFDFTPPSVPADVVATALSSTTIALAWSPSTDASGIEEYRIYRDGDDDPIATVEETGYTDTGLTPGTSYSYTVRAVDRALFPNVSGSSAPASATTPEDDDDDD